MSYHPLRTLIWIGLLAAALLPGCAAPTLQPTLESTRAGGITPFQTAAPTRTRTLPAPGTPTPLPSPTSTPRLHTIARGDELLVIARRYGVTLEALISANPGINPQLLKVGGTLVIPGSPAAPGPAQANPTPAPVVLGIPTCHRLPEGGVNCLVPVSNPSSQAVENVTAVVRLGSPDGAILSRPAVLPLNLLPAGSRLALGVVFPAPAAAGLPVSAEVQTAIPVQAGDGRYLAARLENVRLNFSPDRLLVEIRAEAMLEKTGSPPAKLVWVGAAAFDSSGRAVGVRRWESIGQLTPGQRLPVTLVVYSSGEPIDRVETVVEARP